MLDPTVEKMVDLHRKLEAISRRGGDVVDGWRPLRLDGRGWVIAGKAINDEYKTEAFFPAGEWKKAQDYLEIGNTLRAILFSDLTTEQLNSYRVAVGLPSATL